MSACNGLPPLLCRDVTSRLVRVAPRVTLTVVLLRSGLMRFSVVATMLGLEEEATSVSPGSAGTASSATSRKDPALEVFEGGARSERTSGPCPSVRRLSLFVWVVA